MSILNKYINNETVLVRIKTKSDIGFWEYQILGILSLFMERGNDFFLITEKRILIIIEGSLKFSEEYDNFSEIKFNSNNDLVTFQGINKNIQKVSLSKLKLDYDDYQYLKQKLNT